MSRPSQSPTQSELETLTNPRWTDTVARRNPWFSPITPVYPGNTNRQPQPSQALVVYNPDQYSFYPTTQQTTPPQNTQPQNTVVNRHWQEGIMYSPTRTHMYVQPPMEHNHMHPASTDRNYATEIKNLIDEAESKHNTPRTGSPTGDLQCIFTTLNARLSRLEHFLLR